MASRNAVIMVGWALWCLARPGFAESGTAQVIQVAKSEVVFNAGRREGLVLDTEVYLLRPGSPIVHPLTGQVLGRPQEPVGLARVFEVGDHQSRAVVEKSYAAPQVGDTVEYAPRAGHEPAATHGHEATAQPAAGGHGQEEEAHGHQAAEQTTAAPRGEDHGKAAGAEGEVQQRLKDLERSVEDYHSSSKTLKAYPVFAQRVWDEISTMKSYLVSLDERLVQLEEQQNQNHHLSSELDGDSGSEEGMREFTIRYAPDTQVKLKVAGKTLLISVDHDSLRVEDEGMGAASTGAEVAGDHHEEVGGGQVHKAAESHSSEPAHGAEETHGGEETHGVEKGHGAESAHGGEETHGVEPAHGAEEGHEAQAPWYQSPWMLIGVLPLGLVVGGIWWVIKRRYEEESEKLEADYLEDEEEEEDEDED